MPNQPPLNPDALEAGAKALYNEEPWQKSTYSVESHSWEEIQEEDRQAFREEAEAAVSAYLAVAQPVVNSMPGVYDLGSAEPDGINQIVECDELGHPYTRHWAEDEDYTWSKTTDGTRWKGYKGGKVYMEWPELVRRYGPVKVHRPEVNDA